MAEKTFTNVRLGLKVDTLENWSSSTLPLKRGEVAFATVAATAGNGLTEPVVMMKIGEDGVKTFKDIEWNFYAKASDVLAACKTEKGLTDFINGVITDAKLASAADLTALDGRVATAEGEIDTLQSEMDAVEKKADDNATAIGVLQGLVGGDGKNVATQIQDVITALKLDETYAAKSIEKTVSDHVADTVAHVTTSDKTTWNAAIQASDIATGSANGTIAVKGTDVPVKGLGSAAFTESTAYDASGSAATAEQNAKDYAKSYADGLAGNYDAKGSAAAAEQAAKDYADGLAGNYDAAGSAAAAEKNAKDYADAQILAKVGDKTVSEQIDDLDLANTYAAKEHKHAKADITDFAHNHEITDVNGLRAELDGLQTKGNYAVVDHGHEIADVTGLSDAIADAKKAGTDAQGEVDALEAYVGTFTHDTAKTVVEYINAKTAGIASDAALTELAGRVDTAEDEIDALQAELGTAETGLKARMTAAEGEIDTLNDLVGTESVATQISTAVKEEADRAKGVESGLEARLKAVEDDYLTSDDKEALQTQINTIMNNPDAEGAINSINEFTQYVADHGTIADGFRTDIDKNKGDIAAEVKRAGEAEAALAGRLDTLEAIDHDAYVDADTALKNELNTEIGKKAAKTDLEALAGRVSTVEGDLNTETTGLKDRMTAAESDIDALQTKVGDETVAKQIEDAIAALKIGDYAKAADLTAAINQHNTDKAALETEIGKKANDADLAAIAKTGSTDDLVQGELVLVFDCGTSAE